MKLTDFTKKKILISVGLSFMAVPIMIVGCGGGGGDNDNGPGDDAGGNAVISATTVNDALAWFEGTVPGCQRTGVAGVTSAAASNINNVSVLSEVYSLLKDAKSVSGVAARAPAAAQTFAGDCGGTMSLNSVHQSGNTTYTFAFNNFCSTDTTVTPPEQSIVTGTVTSVENGTPGASGPTVTGMAASTDSLRVVAGGQTVNVSLSNARLDYGAPGTWEPGPATMNNPDRLSVPQATINYETQGKTHTVRNVNASVYESGSNEVMTISSGQYVTSSHGTLNIATSQPLVINSDTGVMSSGALNITGSDGGVVTVAASGASDAKLTISVNGTPLATGMNCSGAQGLLGAGEDWQI
jgi:hypothetical protein